MLRIDFPDGREVILSGEGFFQYFTEIGSGRTSEFQYAYLKGAFLQYPGLFSGDNENKSPSTYP